MEQRVGVTICRKIRGVVKFYLDTFGKLPELVALDDFLKDMIPPAITMEQELRDAVEMHRLLDPERRQRRVSVRA